MKFYRPRSFSLWMFLGAICFVGVCGWMAADSYSKEGMGGFHFFIGVAGAAFFLFAAIAWLSTAISDQPVLDLSPEGLLIRDFARERIAWDDIVDATVYTIRNQSMVKLQFLEPAARHFKLKWLAKFQALLYGKSIFFISTNGMGLSAEKLVKLIARRGVD
jgi:hypothetical protein